MLRYPNACSAGQEGDEEMMVPGQSAGRADLGQNLSDNPAQRVLCQNVVADVILPHAFPSFLCLRLQGCMPRRADSENPRRASHVDRSYMICKKGRRWRFLLPGTSEPRLKVRTFRT